MRDNQAISLPSFWDGLFSLGLLGSLCRTVAQPGMFLARDQLDIHCCHVGESLSA
jgi:hypothetical protein